MENKSDQVFVYVSDDNYAWIMGISMMSVLKHNPKATIYVLSKDISLENREKIEKISEFYGGKCQIIEIPLRYLEEDLNFRKWPAIVFVRLFLAELLPDVAERVVYLDCDTLVLNNLALLWEMDIRDFICCGVKDCIGKEYKKNIGLTENDIYINAGVILINMQNLRLFPVKQRMDEFLKDHYYSNSYGDQDTINAIFKGKIGCLPLPYNVTTIALRWSYDELRKLRHPSGYYSEKEYEHGKLYPAIIHFTGHFWSTRPWQQNSDHEYAQYFLEYKEISPWKEQLITKKSSSGIFAEIENLSMKLPDKIFLVLIGFFHAACYPRYKAFRQQLADRGIIHDSF